MRLDRKNFLVTTGVAAAGAAIGFPAIVGAAPEPIRLGSIPCLTGSNALLGSQEHDGILLAVRRALDSGTLQEGEVVALVGEFQLRLEMGDAVAEFHLHDFFADVRGFLDEGQPGSAGGPVDE